MSSKNNQVIKTRLHPRNRNRERYDLSSLTNANPELANYVKNNQFGVESIDFTDPVAVKLLNKSLLSHYYGIKNWEFPDENLCPPIPGRADYIHHVADLLSENNFGTVPIGDKIISFDIGVGASCIYPIIGVVEYGWNFIGSDIDAKSIESARHIVNSNSSLAGKVDCRLQKNPKDFFYGIIAKEDKIDISICNPPFHSSLEDAQKIKRRKVKNLSKNKVVLSTPNFAGINSELIFRGGEKRFIRKMIQESKKFSHNCLWFSTLVSKQSNLPGIYKILEKFEAGEIKTIPMGTGNKSSRIVAWTFHSQEQRKMWRESRWRD